MRTFANLYSKPVTIGDIRNLAHLNENLEGQLQLFLLACQVNSLSVRSIEDYAQKIGAFVAFCKSIELYRAEEVNPNHIRLFLLGLQRRCKPSSVHGYYGSVCRLFNWLVEEGMLKESPMSRMHPPKVPRQVIQPFSREDIRRMMVVLNNGDSLADYRNRAIVLTFLDTGLRLSELAGIQLSDIDLSIGIIKVMGKGAKERFVRVGKDAQKALLKYVLQRNSNLPCLWITQDRKPLTARGIQQMIERLGKRAGIVGVRCSPHTFRHSFAILCLRNDMGEFALQALLGHSTLAQTRRYTSTLNVDDAMKAHQRASPVDNLRL